MYAYVLLYLTFIYGESIQEPPFKLFNKRAAEKIIIIYVTLWCSRSQNLVILSDHNCVVHLSSLSPHSSVLPTPGNP